MEVAGEIFSWLEKLQIKQTVAHVNGQQRVKLKHPIDGDVSATLQAKSASFSIAGGIAMQPLGPEKLQVYDTGGIFDPIDGRVQGEHYSTSHFALLAAILFLETKDQTYIEQAKSAIDFHLRTASSEYEPMSEWMYHWDFQNYAFVLTYRFLKDFLSPEEDSRWQRGLKAWQTNHRNKLTNWAAMRAWAYAERQALFGNPIDNMRVNWNLRTVTKARSHDGCFDDNVNLSRPIQYHIFTVAILHRLWLLTGNAKQKKWFDEGVNYFLPFIDPEGDFNFIGRGHEQIFGYAAAIYSLEASYKENGDSSHLQAADKIFDYFLQFKRGDHFPLVLNDLPDTERPGWYDYHHLTVYNAHLGAWLALTHLLKNPRHEGEFRRRNQTWVSEPTQMAVISRPKYYAAFFGGLAEYLCEAAITPHHLWWEGLGFVFSCPGGPTPERFGKRTPPDQEKNLFAPIARKGKQWHLPAFKTAKLFQLKDDTLQTAFDYGLFELQREILFDSDVIRITDTFTFYDDVEFDDFRFFNFPIVVDKFSVDSHGGSQLVLTAAGSSKLNVRFDDSDMLLEALEETTTAKGRVRVYAKRRLNFKAKAGQVVTIAFSISSKNKKVNSFPRKEAARA